MEWFGRSRERWIESFVQNGYHRFPSLIEASAISAARARIDRDLEEKYDPARQVEYEQRTFCPSIVATDEIMRLLHQPELTKRIGQLLNLSKLEKTTTGQIAIRRGDPAQAPRPPLAHVDGYPTPQNGVGGNQVVPFAMLVGVFLTEVSQDFAGNFTVWPGSHFVVEEYFNQFGRDAMTQPFPVLNIGKPRQLLASPGDVVLCHYQLAHCAAVNVSPHYRYAVFFRLQHKDLARREASDYQTRTWKHLTQIWTGWKVQPELVRKCS